MTKRTAMAADPPEMLSPMPGRMQARARNRVGSTDLARLAWLLDLLNRRPESFTIMPEQERARGRQ